MADRRSRAVTAVRRCLLARDAESVTSELRECMRILEVWTDYGGKVRPHVTAVMSLALLGEIASLKQELVTLG